MAGRTHYEDALGSWLQARQIRGVGLDESRKACLQGRRLKSFDFIVYPRAHEGLLIDVKGRKLKLKDYLQGRLGQNWTTAADIRDLRAWEDVFGKNYRSVFLFSYWLYDHHDVNPVQGAFRYNGRNYVFRLVDVHTYTAHAKARSAKWDTVFVPAEDFRRLAQRWEEFIGSRERGETDWFDRPWCRRNGH